MELKNEIYKAKTQNKVLRKGILKEVFRQYKKDHPEKSTLQLSKDWKISQPTLTRIEHGTHEVSLEVFLQVLSASQNHHKIAEFLELTDPALYESLNQCFAHSLEKLHYMIAPETVDYLYGNFAHNKNYRPFISRYIEIFANEDYLDILLQASTRNGISKEQLLKKGTQELCRAYTLEQLKIIELDKNEIYRTKEQNFRLPFHIVKKNIEDSLKYYRLSETGQDNNWISLQTESLNSQALKEYKELLRKQFSERAKFLENQDNDGEHCVVTGCYSSTVNAVR